MPVKLFVGNLSPSVSTSALTELFAEYGNVVEADALGKFGFVHMETMEEAEAAISALNGRGIDGVPIRVEISQGVKKDSKESSKRGGDFEVNSTKLFIGNLNKTITSDDLRDLFSKHGVVREADAKGNYGFVHMSTVDEAAACLRELKGAFIGDTPINVEISEEKKRSRDPQPSSGGRTSGGRRGGSSSGGEGGGGPTKLFVGNMNESISSDDLTKLFSRAGEVTEAVAKGRYGFVHMASWDDAQNALRLCNRYQLKGQTLNVEESQSGGAGRDGSGGRSGGDFDRDRFDDYQQLRASRSGVPSGRSGGGRDYGDTTIKIFIGNLTEKTTTSDLITLFSRYGRVKDSDSQACGKFGFVHMLYADDAERAIDGLHGTMLNGTRINVELSQRGVKGGGGGSAGPDRRGRGFRHDDRPYDRPSRIEPPPRDAMAIAEYYQRHGRLPPDDFDRSLAGRDPYATSYSALYERERLAYDAYREALAAREAYRDTYARSSSEAYRSSNDPFVRPPPEAYGSAAVAAAKRLDEYERLAREREYSNAAAGIGQLSAERFTLTPEAAYAISRLAEADRYRAVASSFAATDSSGAARGATNGADSFGKANYTSGGLSSLYGNYGAR